MLPNVIDGVLGWSIALMNTFILPLSSAIAWKRDSINISVAESVSGSGDYTLDLQASRYSLLKPITFLGGTIAALLMELGSLTMTVVPSTSGHFKLSITRDGVGYNTSCISYGSSASSVSDALDYTDPVADLGGASVVRQGIGSSTYDYGYTYTISAANTTLSLGGSIDDIDVAGMGTSVGCSRVSTLGSWDEEANWDTGVVPGSADEVTIPADSGFVALTQDTEVSAMSMSGGALLTHNSTCLPGWTPAPGGTTASFGASKCYKVFSRSLSWREAQRACASAVSRQEAGWRGGALRGSLVTVQGLEENQWVARLCRGEPSDRDCWIGMSRTQNAQGFEEMEWYDLEVVVGDSRYRSWSRDEPNNLQDDEGGQNCVAVHAPKNRASDQGEARWYDAECGSEKPFICQAFGVSTPYTLTVSTALEMLGGYIVGAGTVQSSQSTQVSGDEGEVGILHGATLVNPASASMAWSASVTVGCGGTVQNNGTLTFTGSVSMVATEDTDGFVASTAVDGMDVIWPVLLNDEGGELIVDDGAEVALEWLLWNQGGDILVSGALYASGAGYSSSGNLTIATSGEATFSNSSFMGHQTEAVAITLEADREVTGKDVEDSSQEVGYYRLAYDGETTSCIGYHASALDVQASTMACGA